MTDSIYSLYFVEDVATSGSQIRDDRVILLSPVRDNWNDFSFQTRFDYRVINSHKNIDHSGRLHLAFIESDLSPTKNVRASLSQNQNRPVPTKLEFYTLHESIAGYRELVKQIGINEAQEFLLAINDLVTLNRSRKQVDWITRAVSSEPFKLAFMRNSETFFAFHNAGSVLDGLNQESLEGMSRHLRLEFQLAGFTDPHRLDFQFSESADLRNRIVVVIGKNGVGKSQALNQLIQSLLSGDTRLRDGDGGPPLINRILAVCSPGESYKTFPRDRKRKKIAYARTVLASNAIIKAERRFGDAVVRLARSDESIRMRSRWDLFARAVETVLPMNSVAVRVRTETRSSTIDSASEPELIRLSDIKGGGEAERLARWGRIDPASDVYRIEDGKALPLSSGQLTFIRFAVQVCLHIENGTLVLFDEPETHLHPNYLSDFVNLLDKLLSDTGSLSIIATHTAYLVREVPRDQVVVLIQRAPGIVISTKPRLRTLGADIGAISSFVFEDSLFGSHIEALKEQFQEDPHTAAAALERLKNELSTEAFMYLQRSIDEGKKK